MNVGFYLTGAIPAWAAYAVQAVRAAMPGVHVAQFTDETSPALNVDDVIRKPAQPLSLHRATHFAALADEWLFLDTDAIVQQDVRGVMDTPFDLALSDRQWERNQRGEYRAGGQPEYIARFPYNAGVIFSRCPEFWDAVVYRLRHSPALQESWVGDQTVLCELALSGVYRIKVLPGMRYNFPPDSAHDPLTRQAAIAHYKGKQRKPYLLQRVQVAA